MTNIPVPYRIPIFNLLAKQLNDDFLVIYAARTEPNRSWKLDNLHFNHIFLKENITEKDDGWNYIHNNKDIFKHLLAFRPDYVITTGFNPTHLYGWLYTKIFSKKHIYWSDGTIFTEKHLGILHRILRYLVFNTSHAFIGPGRENKKLYKSYGIAEEKIFTSHLCIDNSLFANNKSFADREYDLMFSGQFIDRKIPHFFVDVIEKLSKKMPSISVLLLGNGPLRNEVITRLNNLPNVRVFYPGFVDQQNLPTYYASSKLFLFTTKLDAWGVVANESLASGTPVFVTPYAGVAHDLIINGYNGYVLDIDKAIWTENIYDLLNNAREWNILSSNAIKSVKIYNFENAAQGISQSCDL